MTTVTVPGSTTGCDPVTVNLGPGDTQDLAKAIAAMVSGGLDSLTMPDNATVSAGAGSEKFIDSGDQTLIFGDRTTGGDVAVTVSGTNDTLVGGNGAITVAATGNALVFGGSGALSFVGGANAATILGGTGENSNVTVGGGGVQFSAGTDNEATIASGPGVATIFGATGSLINFTGNQSGGAFLAGAGNETLNASGSSGADTFSGGAIAGSAVSMVGGSGNDQFFVGVGSDTMTGGGGSDIFAFFKANTDGAHDYITDFNSNDKIYLIGYDASGSASQLQDNATGGGTTAVTLTLSDSTKITFTNVTNESALDGHILYVGKS